MTTNNTSNTKNAFLEWINNPQRKSTIPHDVELDVIAKIQENSFDADYALEVKPMSSYNDEELLYRYVFALLYYGKACPESEKDIDKIGVFAKFAHKFLDEGTGIFEDIEELYNKQDKFWYHFQTEDFEMVFSRDARILKSFEVKEGRKIESYSVPEDIEEIAPWAFSMLSNVKSVCLPKSLKKIGDHCFFGSSDLKNVLFHPECMVETIPIGCFVQCDDLTEIELPASITEIESDSFGESGIRKVTLHSNPSINEKAIVNMPS